MRRLDIVVAFAVSCVSVMSGGCSSRPREQIESEDASFDAGELERDAGETETDAGVDGGTDAGVVDKAAACTDTFGNALTNSFGRLDGKVLAIVQPKDQQCPRPNSDHVILEVTANGAAYRVVINVQSDRPDADIRLRYAAISHALPGDAWSEGWHPGVSFDYVDTLAVHSTDSTFEPYEMMALSQKITDAMELGDEVAVFTTSSGGDSSHLVHRNRRGKDGAIVVRPQSAAPKILLFHFATQTF